MRTLTAEKSESLSRFIKDHSPGVRDFIFSSGYNTTPGSIIEIGHFVCKNGYMDFPDYDENIPLELADSITVLYHDFVTDDIYFEDLYEFVSNNTSACLRAITGA